MVCPSFDVSSRGQLFYHFSHGLYNMVWITSGSKTMTFQDLKHLNEFVPETFCKSKCSNTFVTYRGLGILSE